MKRLVLSLISLWIWQFAHATNEKLPPGCPTIAMSGSPVSCFNGSNGSAQVTISGGSGNYSINWSTGSVISSLSGLLAGTYTVTVIDNVSGCTANGGFVVNQPTPISVTEVVTNVNCRNNITGAINITVIGGSAPYVFDWSNDGTGDFNDSEDLTSVGANTYGLVVKDNKNCLSAKSIIITQPAVVLSSSVTQVNAACFGSTTGSIDLTVFGGTFPYTYSWSNTASSEDISNLTAGAYSVTITDFKGCTKLQTASITQPMAFVSSMSKTDLLCFNNNSGTVNVSLSGGTMPYQYAWQNATNLFAINNSGLTGISAGNYQVNVTDQNGCTHTNSILVNQPSELIISATQINVSCFGESTGSIDLTSFGGSSPYNYGWFNSSSTLIGSTQDLTNLAAGTYTGIVTDFNGCTKTLSKVITQPLLPLTETHTFISVDCFGNNSGSIDVTVNGGTSPFSYTWTNGSSTQDINSLVSEVYGYTITDFKGCSIGGAVTITQPSAPLQITSVITPVVCFGQQNGAVQLTTTGGTMPYTYGWTNSTFLLSNITEDLSNLPADVYAVNISDARGCTISNSFIVTEPTQLNSTVSGVNILCKNGNNGSVDLTVSGGTTPYTYFWNPQGQQSQDLSNLFAGIYDVVITDFNNCTMTNGITLTEPNFALSYDTTIVHVKCNNGNDGSLQVNVQGGTFPYYYLWSNGATTETANQLVAGEYSFLVTDENGCFENDTLIVNQPNPIFMNEVITPVTCFSLSDGKIDVSPTGGTSPYTYIWYNSVFALSTQTQDLIDFPADTYQLELTDSNNCFFEVFWTIPQPTALELSFESDNVNCAGGSDGNILVNTIGGNNGYSYLWNNGSITEDLINVPIGLFTLFVTDLKLCKDSISVQIFEPDPVDGTFDVTPVSCKDQYDGALKINAIGGLGAYQYSWSTGATSNEIIDLPTAEYSVTITDILGCSIEKTVLVGKLSENCIFPVNTFTPNGDSYNDTWFIENASVYPNAVMQVYNKWGTVLYESKGLYVPWDGTSKGAMVPADVYYYILYLNNPSGDELKGSITLIR